MTQEHPFRHAVVDDFISLELGRAASMEWPDERWPYWHRYDGREGLKYASKDALRLPPACAEIVRRMLGLSIRELLGIEGTFPDFGLHGAGMHMIPPGGDLPLHRDSDHNPLTGWGRAVSCVLWIDSWQTEWGGALRLWDADRKAPVISIEPKAGRLVIFECGDQSWHDVSRVSIDAPIPRRSLAVFFWWPVAQAINRPRAEFV